MAKLTRSTTGMKRFTMGKSEFKTQTLLNVPMRFKIEDPEGKLSNIITEIPTYVVDGDVPYLL